MALFSSQQCDNWRGFVSASLQNKRYSNSRNSVVDAVRENARRPTSFFECNRRSERVRPRGNADRTPRLSAVARRGRLRKSFVRASCVGRPLRHESEGNSGQIKETRDYQQHCKPPQMHSSLPKRDICATDSPLFQVRSRSPLVKLSAHTRRYMERRCLQKKAVQKSTPDSNITPATAAVLFDYGLVMDAAVDSVSRSRAALSARHYSVKCAQQHRHEVNDIVESDMASIMGRTLDELSLQADACEPNSSGSALSYDEHPMLRGPCTPLEPYPLSPFSLSPLSSPPMLRSLASSPTFNKTCTTLTTSLSPVSFNSTFPQIDAASAPPLLICDPTTLSKHQQHNNCATPRHETIDGTCRRASSSSSSSTSLLFSAATSLLALADGGSVTPAAVFATTTVSLQHRHFTDIINNNSSKLPPLTAVTELNEAAAFAPCFNLEKCTFLEYTCSPCATMIVCANLFASHLQSVSCQKNFARFLHQSTQHDNNSFSLLSTFCRQCCVRLCGLANLFTHIKRHHGDLLLRLKPLQVGKVMQPGLPFSQAIQLRESQLRDLMPRLTLSEVADHPSPSSMSWATDEVQDFNDFDEEFEVLDEVNNDNDDLLVQGFVVTDETFDSESTQPAIQEEVMSPIVSSMDRPPLIFRYSAPNPNKKRKRRKRSAVAAYGEPSATSASSICTNSEDDIASAAAKQQHSSNPLKIVLKLPTPSEKAARRGRRSKRQDEVATVDDSRKSCGRRPIAQLVLEDDARILLECSTCKCVLDLSMGLGGFEKHVRGQCDEATERSNKDSSYKLKGARSTDTSSTWCAECDVSVPLRQTGVHRAVHKFWQVLSLNWK